MKIGVLGGGQLGRMLGLAGIPLGHEFVFYDPFSDSPAREVGQLLVAEYDNNDKLEQFAKSVDVVTYEFENVPLRSAALISKIAKVYPPPEALRVSQDRLFEKQFFAQLGIAISPFRQVESQEELFEAVNQLGLPAVLKTRRLGYDGKGQHVLRNPEDVVSASRFVLPDSAGWILEGFVKFKRELSIISCRFPGEKISHYPLTWNHHRDGILNVSVAPAVEALPETSELARQIAETVLKKLDYIGTLAIELFEQEDGSLLVNEMAPRVHNSGHWTINGAFVSQFENHIRAVSGLPPGSTHNTGLWVMKNIIGEYPDLSKVLSDERAQVHLYGKSPRAGRKLGHINYHCASRDEQLKLAKALLKSSHL
jgi:5-(carboxyamino)imidazole ribonucleotide synthase